MACKDTQCLHHCGQTPAGTLPSPCPLPSPHPRAGWSRGWGGQIPPTHIGVVVVAVGGQKDLPHLLHAAQQQRHPGLARGKSAQGGRGDPVKGTRVGGCPWGGVGGMSADTHILHHVFLQVLQGLLLQAALQTGQMGLVKAS